MAPRVPINLQLQLTDKQLDETVEDMEKDGVISQDILDPYEHKGLHLPDHNYSEGPHPPAGGYFGTEPPSGATVSRLSDDDDDDDDDEIPVLKCQSRSSCREKEASKENLQFSGDDDDEIPVLKCQSRSSCREKEASKENFQFSKIGFTESGDDSLKSKFNLLEYLMNDDIPLTLISGEKMETELITNFKVVKPYADLSSPNKRCSFKCFIPMTHEINSLVDLVLEDEKVHGIYESEPISSMNYSDDHEASSSSIDVETIDSVPSTSKARSSRTKRKKHTFDNKTKRRKTVKRGNSPKKPVKRGRKPKSNGAKENVKVKRIYQKRNQTRKGGVLQPSPGNNPNSLCNSRDVAGPSRMHVDNYSEDEEVVTSKRMKPVVAERMRRQKLKEFLEKLRCTVPGVCQNPKASQVAILQAAAPEARRLREQRKKLEEEREKLVKEMAMKVKRIEKLLMHAG